MVNFRVPEKESSDVEDLSDDEDNLLRSYSYYNPYGDEGEDDQVMQPLSDTQLLADSNILSESLQDFSISRPKYPDLSSMDTAEMSHLYRDKSMRDPNAKQNLLDETGFEQVEQGGEFSQILSHANQVSDPVVPDKSSNSKRKALSPPGGAELIAKRFEPSAGDRAVTRGRALEEGLQIPQLTLPRLPLESSRVRKNEPENRLD